MTDAEHPADDPAPLTEDQHLLLVSRLGDLAPADDATRARHLATALEAYDAIEPSAPSAPLDLAAARVRRRHRSTSPWLAAAATVLVVGVGVAVALGQNGVGSSADQAEVADAPAQLGTDAGAAGDDSGAGGKESSETATAAADAAPPQESERSVDAAAPVPDLGSVVDDAALAAAVDVLTDAAPASTIAGATEADAVAADGTCDRLSSDRPVATAVVAGRRVLVVTSGEPPRTEVIDLVDCTRRPL